MPTLKYALESDGPKRLEIAYSLGIRNATIRFDGKEIGKVESRKALNEGRDFDLPDGSTLTLHLFGNGFGSKMFVLRDGAPVPGSASDPDLLIKNAYQVLFIIAGASILIGLGTALFHIEFLASLSGGWLSVAFGIVFLILGFAVREGSSNALKAGLLLFLIDSAFLVIAIINHTYSINWGAIFVRGYLIFTLIQGVQAMAGITYEKPKRGEPRKQKQQTRSWTNLEKSLVILVIILIPTVGGLLFVTLNSHSNAERQEIAALPTLASLPNAPPIPIIVYPKDYPPLMLNLKAQTPQPTINIPTTLSDTPLFPGDLAWNQPTFANRYYEAGFPSLTTSGSSGWRSASSNGSWLYVDLGRPQTIHQLIVNHFVDAHFTNSPQSYYIVSDDLVSWRVIVDEINTANSYMRFKPRIITLQDDVTARYVGIFAQDWHGGWGGVQSFSAIKPGYNYTYETLPKI